MAKYLLNQFQDILGINCTLDEVWDKSSTEVYLPDGSCFAIMEDGQITFYKAQYGVTVHLRGVYPMYSPERYPVFRVEGLYMETSAYQFDIL